MRILFLKFLLLLFFPISVLFANDSGWIITPNVQYNQGRFIFETGGGNLIPSSKDNSYGSGSRLTYAREYPLLGVSAIYIKKNWEFQLQGHSTFGYRNSGNFRDEDFYLFTPSYYSNRFAHYGPFYGYDPIWGNHQLTRFSGASNWSDFDSSLKANDSIVGFDVRYFPSGGSPNPNVKGFGLFVIGGYSYEYLKFIVNEASGSQLSSGKIYFGYLNGENISYSNSINEIKYGIGTQTNFQRWGLEVSFSFVSSEIKSRDFHRYRTLTFLESAYGNGWTHTIKFNYKLSENLILNLNWTESFREFEGKSHVKAGLGPESWYAGLVSFNQQYWLYSVQNQVSLGVSIFLF
ncbi:putative porin [Leptospira noguchii]|uniref:putative porin n=1 Tax=Leptospira noguchii TaxID=28182 RepID=UPI001F06F104|nr:putative porin [Leptospira noguchii]MCH1915126.1 putative porin [Leptospira noguchii]UOG65011.1 putative porin [Leptospira noguchii]